MPDLLSLRRRRDGYRGRSTTAINTARTVLDGLLLTPAQLQGQVDVLQRLLTTLDDYDNQILELLIEADDVEAEIVDTGTYQDPLTTTISTLKDAKAELLTRRSDAGSQIGNVNPVAANVNQGPAHAIARLPQLELPRFSGDPLQWSSFWDSYESSIHSNARLSDVDKFNYLRSLLSGVALDSIAGIAITNLNYPTAVTLIRGRFGQQQAIINAHVEALVTLRKSTEDTAKLRSLYDNAEIHIRGLETLGITAAQNGAVLTPILLVKIPDDIRLTITRKNDGPIGDLDRLRELFRVEIEARELSMLSKKQQPVYKPARESIQDFTTGTLFNSSVRIFCGFCQQPGHRSSDCQVYSNTKQRQDKMWKEKLCHNCLSRNHASQDCRSQRSCQMCQGRHHTSLCRQTDAPSPPRNSAASFKKPWNRHGKNSNANIANSERRLEDAPPHTVNASPTLLSNTSSVWMQTALARIPDATGILQTVRLLFDTGSDRSYITSSLAEKLSLKADSSAFLLIAPFGQKRSSSKHFDVTSFECTDYNGQSYHQLSAVIVPSITCPLFKASIKTASSVLKHLKMADPPKQSDEWITIDILIGLDHYWDLVQDQVVRLPDEGLIAISSVFGWLVSGAIRDGKQRPEQTSALFVATADCSEDNQLTKFWQNESLEFAESQSKLNTIEQDLVLQRFDATISIHDSRYQVGLPWKEDGPELPTNCQLSMKRFKSLINRLTREDLISQYNDVIADQFKRGFIEVVNDSAPTPGIVHYIPHHLVLRKDHATTKLRIVYDASAKQSANDPSLNESLYSGPNLIADLMELLLVFRKHKVVILADIEKAFLQVGLHPEDRDATRFFWLKDPSKPFSATNVVIYRFCRVPFGATSSPFLLAATLRYHLLHTEGQAATKMLNNFYVDNLVTGATCVSDATTFYSDAKQIMSAVGMNLREWVSNCPEFMDSIPQIDRATGIVIKVLGIPWNVVEDIIHVQGVPVLYDEKTAPTKRQILRKAKIFIQSLWKASIHWDDVPAHNFLKEWKQINDQLKTLDTVKVPRHLRIEVNSQLHVFVDASSKAYAAVAYIRTPLVNSTTEFTTGIICSKSRVAPVNMITTPRLELMAALVGCQLAEFVQKTYSIANVQLWSDSEIVLYWIRNLTQKQGVFVSNRLNAINGYGFPFRHVPTKDNPADLPSRGVDSLSRTCKIWWEGPTWLCRSENHWPSDVITKPGLTVQTRLLPLSDPHRNLFHPQYSGDTICHVSEEPQNQRKDALSQISLVTKASVQVEQSPFSINVQRFSSLSKLFRVTALCARCIQRLQKKYSSTGPVTVEELIAAKSMWIQSVQNERFGDQLRQLKKKKSDSIIRSMSLVLDGEFLKCHGRLANSMVPVDTNMPIILPPKNRFTDLVIQDQYEKLYHSGVRHTLSALRQAYWIPTGRQQVRYVLRKCRICRLWEGGAYSNPPPPPLPSMRVTKSPAFMFTGCDFAGPLLVFNGQDSSKAYICLFTCAVTRAVHLELVEDMTAHCFLMALRRFIARRGCPQEIISDNAKTFKLSNQVLDRLWHNLVISDETLNFVSNQGIKWKFNVERAPWWGGFFEKMIGLTKRTLIKAVGKTKLNAVELSTVPTEVEAVLNSRPLTYVYNDLANGQPLTPFACQLPL